MRFWILPGCAAIALLAGQTAWADCTPAAAHNVTAICTGSTTNQGGGAPGTSAGVAGYGTGIETGVTVSVASGAANTLTGINNGIFVGDATVTNNASASITGGDHGIYANAGSADVMNSGSITGTLAGVLARANATVTNNAGAVILSLFSGIIADLGSADVTNSGDITGTFNYGILAATNATVTNNAGAGITGGVYGLYASAAGSSVVNAGTISGGIAAIRFAGSGNTLTLEQGSIINGNVLGTGSDTFQLGGTGAATFDVSTLGPAAQYQGFNTFNKIGTSTWTLTGTTAVGTPWTVNQGSLSISSDGNLGGALGGLTFDGGALQLGAGFNLAATRAINLNFGGGTIDTNGFSTTISQGIIGVGGLTKVGSGTLTLSGNNGYVGGTTVNGGTLVVDGSIMSTTVNSGGTLAGSGTVGETQINSGAAFAPGNGAAGSSMTVSGNLAFQSGAQYLVQLNPATSSFATATGTATLGGATVKASFAPGSYVARQYTILHSDVAVNGTFAGPVNTNLPANFHTSLSYDANNAYLDLILNFAVPSGLNQNQQNVANTLVNFFDTTGSIPLVFGALTPTGLTQVSGEIAVGSQQSTFNAMTQFLSVMTDLFTAGRGDAPSATAFAGDALNAYAGTARKRSGLERGARDMIAKAAPRAPPFEAR
jgi:autotransporter-associated beta strand protein